MAFLWHLQRRVANPATIATATATSTSATESGVVRTVVGASKTNTGIAGYRGHQNQNQNHVRGFYSSCSRRNAAAAAATTTTTTTTTSTTTTTKLLRGNSRRPHLSLFGNSSRRCLSFYENGNNNNNNNNPPNMGSAAYVVYGEEVAFGIKAIPPEFRVLPSGTVILDNGKRGRFLFEWTPVDNAANTGAAAAAAGGFGFGGETANTNAYRRFRWDATTRFALTAEEAASLLARLDRGDETVEFSRRLPGEHPQNPVGRPLDKVFVAKTIRLDEEPEMQQQQQMQEEGDSSTSPPMPASSSSSSSNPPKPNGLSLLVDYVDPDQQRYGQIPHPITGSGAGGMYDATEGFRGPFEIHLMIGEYQVLRSILEQSIPKLVGWTTMLDRNIEQSIAKSLQGGASGSGSRSGGGGGNYRRGGGYGGPSPHNYQGGGNNDGNTNNY